MFPDFPPISRPATHPPIRPCVSHTNFQGMAAPQVYRFHKCQYFPRPANILTKPLSSIPLFPRSREHSFCRHRSKSEISFSHRFFHMILISWRKMPRIYLKIDRPFLFHPSPPHTNLNTRVSGPPLFYKIDLPAQGVFNKSKMLFSCCVALVFFFCFPPGVAL